MKGSCSGYTRIAARCSQPPKVQSFWSWRRPRNFCRILFFVILKALRVFITNSELLDDLDLVIFQLLF